MLLVWGGEHRQPWCRGSRAPAAQGHLPCPFLALCRRSGFLSPRPASWSPALSQSRAVGCGPHHLRGPETLPLLTAGSLWSLLLVRRTKVVFSFFKTLFIHETHTHRGRDTGRGRSKLPAGFDPRTPGSPTQPKADAQPLSHPGAPSQGVLRTCYPKKRS